ncbi:hypothetical protein ACW9YQ_17905 (plasmid) [Paraburkholderia strydomiana]
MRQVDLDDKALIRDIQRYANIPYQKLPVSAIDYLRRACADSENDPIVATASVLFAKHAKRVVRALDIYLCVTGQTIDDDWSTPGDLSGALTGFLGALSSERFISLTQRSRYSYLTVVIHLLELSNSDDVFSCGTTAIHYSLKPLLEQFEALTLDPEQVWIWRGWPTKNKNGKVYWLPLYPVYLKLGQKFCDSLYVAISDYIARGRREKIAALAAFIDALSRFEGVTQESLLNPFFVRSFWEFCWSHYQVLRGQTCSAETLIRDWVREWTRFTNDVLVRTGILAKCPGQFPGPEVEKTKGRPKSKELEQLLVKPALTLSDREALEYLVVAIPKSVEQAVVWAKAQIADLALRRKKRKVDAHTGTARLLFGSNELTDRDNPLHVQNAAATFHQHGFLTRNDFDSIAVLYPDDLGRTAHDLGLPTTGALLPHAALLVAKYPNITPSFLEHLEAFDDKGRLIATRTRNGVTYLKGHKYRAGKKRAVRLVPLDKEGLRVVRQILAATTEVRRYLRQRKDPACKKLFLSCKHGFGYPRPVSRFSTYTSAPQYKRELVRQFCDAVSMGAETARNYVESFTLRTLRNSKALSVFMDTHSEAEMAKALGHAHYRPGLLASYLPEELQAFYRERWMRVYQTNLVVMTLADSPYRLEASGFATADMLDQFLLKNAFPKLTTFANHVRMIGPPMPTDKPREDSRIIFNASEEVLTVLASMRLARETGMLTHDLVATYWTDVSSTVLSYLEGRKGIEPSIDKALSVASAKASVELVAGVL